VDHHFQIDGIRWLWRYVRLRGKAIGWTYPAEPNDPKAGRKILIDSGLRGRSRLEIEIHEFLHAANPTQSEEHVDQQGRDLAKILWSLGYRLPTEGSLDRLTPTRRTK